MSVLNPADAAAAPSVAQGRVPVRGYVYGLIGVAIWAGWAVLTRRDLRGDLAITDLVALRFATAGLILLPVLIWKGLPWRRIGIGRILLMAGCAGAPYVLIAGGGHAFAPVSHSGVLICCGVPLATAIMAKLFLRERFSTPRLIGYGLILASAVVLMVEASMGGSIGPNVLLGDLMFIAGATMWGGYTVLARQLALDPLHSTSIVAVISAAIYLPVYLIFLEPGVAAMPWGIIAEQAVFQGLITSVISLLAFSTAIKWIGASRTGALSALVPGLAVVLAIPVLNEGPTPVEIVGILLGTLGVALASGAVAFRLGRTGKKAA